MQWPQVIALVLSLVALAAIMTVAHVVVVNPRAWDAIPSAVLWVVTTVAVVMLAAVPVLWILGWSIVDGGRSPSFAWLVISLVGHAATSLIVRRSKDSRRRHLPTAVIALAVVSAILVSNSDLNGETENVTSSWRWNGNTPWRATLKERDVPGTGDLRIIAHSRLTHLGFVTRRVYDRTFVVDLAPEAKVEVEIRSDSDGDHARITFGDTELDDGALPRS